MTREEAKRILYVYRAVNLVDASHREAFDMAISELEKESCGDAISRQAVIEVLNKMDRYVADELTLCDTERKFPQNEVFIVDDVYEEIVEQLPPVKPTEKVRWWRYYENMLSCPECGAEYYDDIMHYCGDDVPKYCPSCGCKMTASPTGAERSDK